MNVSLGQGEIPRENECESFIKAKIFDLKWTAEFSDVKLCRQKRGITVNIVTSEVMREIDAGSGMLNYRLFAEQLYNLWGDVILDRHNSFSFEYSTVVLRCHEKGLPPTL